MTLEFIETCTGPTPNASVIWLHGLGADGHDFENIVPQLQLPADLAIRFIFPHAPVRPVTLNGGMSMRAWFDLVSLDPHSPADHAGIEASTRAINVLIKAELDKGIPAERIILAGFSQGGSMALYIGLHYPKRLAGLMGLSCFIPESALDPKTLASANQNIPIFITHGHYDPVVPYSFGELTRDTLKQLNYHVSWRDYEMEHQVSMEEIRDISQWIQEVLI